MEKELIEIGLKYSDVIGTWTDSDKKRFNKALNKLKRNKSADVSEDIKYFKSRVKHG